MHLHLKGKKYLCSDQYQYWIQSETPGKNKKGEDVINTRRLSGYRTDIIGVFDSYFEHTLRESEIEGEIAELGKLVKKTKNEIHGWFKDLVSCGIEDYEIKVVKKGKLK